MSKPKTRLFHTIVVVGAALTSPLVHAEKSPPPEAKAPTKKTAPKKKRKTPAPPPRPIIEPTAREQTPQPPPYVVPIEPGPTRTDPMPTGKPVKP